MAHAGRVAFLIQAILLWCSVVQAQSEGFSDECCSIYSIPSQTASNGGALLSTSRTILESGPDAYKYSAIGAPPSGQRGTLVTRAEALQFVEVSQVFVALQRPLLSLLESGNYSLNQWDDFHALLSNYTAGYAPPYSLPFWESDAFFGFMRKSVAAQYLTAAQTLPFALTDTDVSELLGSQTLQGALSSRKLYVENLSYPSSFPPSFFRTSRYAVDVVSLFFEDDQGFLLPIAISVADSAGVWTPKDAPYDWLLAKLYANTAAYLLVQTNHFFRQHIVPSSMRIAANNRLYTSHPVYHLVEHYTAGDWGIAATGLERLYQEGGGDYAWPYYENGTIAVLELVKSSFIWTTDDLETNVAARGLSNLSNFPFLDDMRAHSAAIRNITDAFLGLYYLSDRTAGILTRFVRLVSVEHHLMNMYVIYKVYTTPFANRFMTSQPPASRGTVDASTILQYIPTSPEHLSNIFHTAAAFRVVLQPKETIVGAFKVSLFEPCAQAAVRAYVNALQGIEAQINAREASATYPFPLALPSILPYRAFI